MHINSASSKPHSVCGVQYKVAVFVFDNRAYALHGFPLHRERKIGFVIVFLHAVRIFYDARLHFEFGLQGPIVQIVFEFYIDVL